MLLLFSGYSTVIWSSKFIGIRCSTDEDFVWQSFDHPTDTLLAGMKLGKDLVIGVDRYLTSWKSMDDPSPGLYVSWMDTNGYPQAFQKRGSVLQLRFGPGIGVRFSGFPVSQILSTRMILSSMKRRYIVYFILLITQLCRECI
ncbi:putative bulb-type lectin domain-containing protein [Helianthus anomalus]